MDARFEGQPEAAGPGDALAEGRRIYLGNLLYAVKPSDVEHLLQQAGFGNFEKLHISVDPVSGRNPGYCFIEFPTRDEADAALAALPGTPLFGRPVKVGPCHPKSAPQSRWPASRGADYTPTFQRWGDWKGDDGEPGPVREHQQQGPYGALRHLDARSGTNDHTQLYIGGLGKMISQEHHDTEMRELLAGFDVVAIGKRITPHHSTRSLPGNHHYCFVYFGSDQEAERAIRALNGKPVEGGALRVSRSKNKSPAFHAHPPGAGSAGRGSADGPDGASFTGRRDEQDRDRGEQRERSDRQRAIMASSNWRSGGRS